MAEKLSWTELRRALAARAGVSEKKAGAFLNAVQAQLVEALKSDKQVKINGLGTFKLQAVAPRKSVNVTTGEEIMIEGYNKLAFTPEAGVRELIEKGNGKSTSLEMEPAKPVADPIQKLGAQADEIVDLLGDLGQSPETEKKPKKAKKAKKAEKPVAEPEPVIEPKPEEPVVAPEPEPKAEPAPIVVPPASPVEPIVVEQKVVIEQPKPKKKSHFLRDTLICVVILLLLLLVGYFFLRQQLTDIIESFLQPAQTEVVAPVSTDTIAAEEAEVVEAIEEAPEAEEPVAEPTQEAPKQSKKAGQSSSSKRIPKGNISQEQILAEFLQASGEYDESRYPELITIEPMHEGSRLAWMSKRYYGAKIYWPYLYDANRDILVNPSMIEVGTPIRVPKLTAEQLDTMNAQTAAFIEQLRLEAEEASKK